MNDISYLTDRYDEKIKKISDFDVPLNFVFITDQHNRMNEYTTTWDKTNRPDERVILPEEMHEICMKHNPAKEIYFYIDFDERCAL